MLKKVSLYQLKRGYKMKKYYKIFKNGKLIARTQFFAVAYGLGKIGYIIKTVDLKEV